MGNRISLCGCAADCGIPTKRRKTKRRKAEKILQAQEAERYEALLRAETADHQEYYRLACFPVPASVPGQSPDQTSEAQLKSDTTSKKSENEGKTVKEPFTDVSTSLHINMFSLKRFCLFLTWSF